MKMVKTIRNVREGFIVYKLDFCRKISSKKVPMFLQIAIEAKNPIFSAGNIHKIKMFYTKTSERRVN